MNSETLHHIQTWFTRYVNGFPEDTLSFESMINIKVVHSRIVEEICRSLAEELGWSREDIVTASALGLLHDAGRFSQFTEYGTFSDADSVDHGRRGYEVVKESGILSRCSETVQNKILEGILFHNLRTIPPGVLPDSLPFVKLIRDGDKLDIYRIIRERIENNQLGDHLKEALFIRAEGPANPLAIGEIWNRETVSNENLFSMADFTLMQMSWVFDINYPPTLRRIRESGILNILACALPDEKEAKEAADFILKQAG
ncbi:MAG: HD domain-containing protein [Candidatus Latescibacterota bacterium]